MTIIRKIIVGLLLFSMAACNPNKVNDADKEKSGSAKEMDTVKLTGGASLLFAGIKTKLNKQQQNDVFALLGFQCTPDNKQFYEKDGEDFPFSASIYPTDLNGDGREELFVLYGNTFVSGNTGSSIILLMPDVTGKYRANLGFPGLLPDVIQTKKGSNYPDLLIGMPGNKIPVWQWNGKEYVFKKSVSNGDIKKLQVASVEQYSILYQKKSASTN